MNQEIREDALKELQEIIEKSAVTPDQKAAIGKVLKRARSPLDSDRWIYRLVVGSLGSAILASVTFAFLLVWTTSNGGSDVNVKIPEIFMAIASAAVGALAGLLAPSPNTQT